VLCLDFVFPATINSDTLDTLYIILRYFIERHWTLTSSIELLTTINSIYPPNYWNYVSLTATRGQSECTKCIWRTNKGNIDWNLHRLLSQISRRLQPHSSSTPASVSRIPAMWSLWDWQMPGLITGPCLLTFPVRNS